MRVATARALDVAGMRNAQRAQLGIEVANALQNECVPTRCDPRMPAAVRHKGVHKEGGLCRVAEVNRHVKGPVLVTPEDACRNVKDEAIPASSRFAVRSPK